MPVRGAATTGNLDLSELDAELVNIVHDELVVESADEDVPEVKSAVEQAMVRGMLAIFPDATTRGLVEAASGTNWAEAK